MRRIWQISLLAGVISLTGCNPNAEGVEDVPSATPDSSSELTAEEVEGTSHFLLTMDEQMELRQTLTDFFGSDEAFANKGFAYVDGKQSDKGIVGIKDLNQDEMKELKATIYQEFTEEEVAFVEAKYTSSELSKIQDDVLDYLTEIGVSSDISEQRTRDFTIKAYPNLKEQKVMLTVNPITDEQLQDLKDEYGDVLIVEVPNEN